tara:strand:+ start:115 stop:555 length:441 start_codon:yes stop_codon:yes gene_type:complete
MTPRFQRLLLIIITLIFVTLAILLILINSKKNLIFFYTPSEFLLSNSKLNEKIRIGGYVLEDSIIREHNNLYNFIITDNQNKLNVTYQGTLPDLFKEGQGAVIEGIIMKDNVIKATTVFAKHDENYIPESLKKELKNNKYWKKEYE